MRKVIIDCDPGHDDAMALLLAFAHPDTLDVLAVGTVGGNHHLDKITQNAQRILQVIHQNVLLYQGCFEPFIQALPIQPGAHGDSGMDGLSVLDDVTYPIEAQHAVEGYKELLMRHKNVTLIGLGPLTNIAMLLKMYPQVKSSIEMISIMGGGIDHGNVTPYAEFNIYADPEAAKIVFESGIPITMAGLDVTEKSCLSYEQILSLKNQGTVSHFSYELLEFYHQSGKQFGFDESAIHDAVAVACLIYPELFVHKDYAIEISCSGITRGMTATDLRLKQDKEKNVKALIDVDQEKFSNLLLQAIQLHDRRQ
ncbi:nucleoside hydrolase [Erysipelothrix urinaevulpis]|uniref:nucleoside hydrolase n=1 Tax=Erysipelothrix urinaevulpis TaxID=2683717 RepID=UPI00135CCDC4|nr:nucleoside hydrolase [Erysipelothrix urinaevulpis]